MTANDGGLFNLAATVREVARAAPDRTAIIEPVRGRGKWTYRRFSYARLSEHAESVAVGLRKLGIRERTRTVYMAPPSFEAAVATVALNRVGATVLMIDPSVGYRNVAERLRRVKPEAMVGVPLAHAGRGVFGWGPRTMKRAVSVGGWFPGTRTLASLKEPVDGEPPMPDVQPDDVAAILYTTGSTGPAKPAAYLHRQYSAVHRVAHQGWGFATRDEVPVDLVAFPAFMSVALTYGGTCVVPPIDFAKEGPADVDPAAIVDVVRDCRVRTFFASPALLERVADHAHRHGLLMPSLVRVIGGGAPLFPPLMRALLDVMGDGAEVCANYGATEALPSTELSSKEVFAPGSGLLVAGRGICVGRPFPGLTVRVVPLVDGVMPRTSAADELPPDALGELIVSGPNVSARYHDEPESTEKNKTCDEQGTVWHRLGDVGCRDESGRFWVAGRVGHMIKTADDVLCPMHAETILDTHPDVRRSGLVGVRSGDVLVPVACVELREGKSVSERQRIERELLRLLSENDRTRKIDRIVFRRRLPVDPRHNAKIERPALAKWAARALRRKR